LGGVSLPLPANIIFTARRYSSAVYAVVVCLSVCRTPELYQKRLNIGSRKQRHTIAKGL